MNFSFSNGSIFKLNVNNKTKNPKIQEKEQ
jgi:hypothetical protein